MISFADIDQERSDILKRVLSTTLRHVIVVDVFAQVIDGLPIESMYEIILTSRTDLSRRLCDDAEVIVLGALGLNPTV